MRTYQTHEIAAMVDAHSVQLQHQGAIHEILLDSRQVLYPEASLFFALVGERFDAHTFIPQLYQQGVRNFCVCAALDYQLYPEANFWLVSNTTRALQKFVEHDRHHFDLEVIGITGSNGKTIVKEWLYQLLQADQTIVRSPKSYNSQIGVPLSVWQITAAHTLGIFEVGISRPDEMKYLSPLVDCTIGIFTNLGTAHQEGFSSLAQKATEKLLLFEGAETIIFCKDFPELNDQLQHRKTFSWSRTQAADLQIVGTQSAEKHTTIAAMYLDRNVSITIPFADTASIDNAITCWCYLLLKQYPDAQIQQHMLRLEPLSMRLELLAANNGCSLINDSYSVDLSSLKIALQFLSNQSTLSKKTIILSDILQSGLSVDELYQQVAQVIHQNQVQRFIGIGAAIRNIAPYLSDAIQTSFFEDTATFLKQLSPHSFQHEAILVKGARSFGFEQIVNRLVEKIQPTHLEINLTALSHNLGCYQKTLQPGVKVMAMVKAAAYGSGAFEIAKLLQPYVGYLTVAYPDEGVELRKAGITAPIMVLNVSRDSFETMFAHQLEPEIFSLTQLRSLLEQRGVHQVKIHLKLDTGMKRLGFEAQDIPQLSAVLADHPQLTVASIFTHLAASEASEHDDFTAQQVRLFDSSYRTIVQKIGYAPMRHVLNSSGTSRFPAYQYEMVRLGIGLYGIDYHAPMATQLRTVLTLRATISQIKSVEAGQSVGYGRKGVAKQNSRIATISIGYADGFLRAAGNGRYSVWMSGHLAPTIGNICMDMSMIDITDIPEAKEGDIVEIFGENQPVSALAHCYQTIAYEVFTGIAARVKRVYYVE